MNDHQLRHLHSLLPDLSLDPLVLLGRQDHGRVNVGTGHIVGDLGLFDLALVLDIERLVRQGAMGGFDMGDVRLGVFVL